MTKEERHLLYLQDWLADEKERKLLGLPCEFRNLGTDKDPFTMCIVDPEFDME